jgi:hypothetical protein
LRTWPASHKEIIPDSLARIALEAS